MQRRDVERVDEQGFAAWNEHDPDRFVALLGDKFVWRDAAMPGPMTSPDEARAYVQSWLTAFPDMHLQRTNRLVDEDRVAAELEFTGTNTGPVNMGGQEIPATGRRVTGHGTYFSRVENGKIVEFSTYPDVAEMMAQLGMMPQR